MADSVVANNGPEELLRGALEKIVFFECRLSQLNAELIAERASVVREKEAAATVRAREIELEMLLAQARSTINTMKLRVDELEERVRLLEAERELFMAGFVGRAQVISATVENNTQSPGEQTDLAALAGFIAELREKIEQLKLWKSAAQKAGIVIEEQNNPKPSETIPTVSILASRFENAGRLSIVTDHTDRMKEQFATKAERSLYETSMEDLQTADPERRKRAADCLRALGSHFAAPLITAALGRESDPAAKVALLRALAATAEPSAVTLAVREIADRHPEVRAAALDATSALAKEHAEPALVGAINDSSSFVRRRVALLLSFINSTTATEALSSMLSDQDPSVVRVAARALSGRPDIRAQSALINALDHPESAVRRYAADAVKSWSGEVVDPNALPAERRRAARRLADKLTRLEEGALRKAVIQVSPVSATIDQPSAVHQKPEIVPGNPPTPKPQIIEMDKKVIVDHASVPVSQIPVQEKKHSVLEGSLIGEIRTSLRGRTAEELSVLTNAELAAVSASLTTLVNQGIISQRGPRFFMS
ncbi:MAG TPA: HEAT repeat domain-containing protein [Chitinispirillaceae bacterium]|nr:HEAT repeat domain-containing protein [Chitinispirillaceae bacterium]